MTTSPPGEITRVTLDYNEVHEVSKDLLTSMSENDVPVPIGVAALCLSLGRLMTPKRMEDEEEIEFMQDFLDWCGMYFSKGKVN